MTNEPKESRRRLPPLTGTKRGLYLYSGNQCAFDDPPCPNRLVLESGTLNAQIAHIQAVGEWEARGNHTLSDEQLRAPENLVLLCLTHHAEVDKKDLEHEYTVERVRAMKAKHEARFRKGVEALEELFDTTLGVTVTSPANGLALGDPGDAEGGRQQLATLQKFVDQMASLPRTHRAVLEHILAHGNAERPAGLSKGRVSADIKTCKDTMSWSEPDWEERVRSLQATRLLEPDYDDRAYDLRSSADRRAEFNYFVELKELARDRSDLRTVLLDLDFTIFDA